MKLSAEALDRIENGALEIQTRERLKATMLDAFIQMEQEGYELQDFADYLDSLLLKAKETAEANGHFETF